MKEKDGKNDDAVKKIVEEKVDERKVESKQMDCKD